ncbi:MAG: serine/threonine protein kinase, partial [Actinomycetia bacterium]|nr:serine/threonine protein kinase [Actinomycetes bacterium]
MTRGPEGRRPQDQRPGDIGRYRPGAVLATGFGTVTLRAEDTRLARAVALKVLAPAAVDDPAARARLVQEARRAAAFDHPNVVPLLDAGEADGVVYLA